MNYLKDKLLQREQYNILSEEDRLKIRHTLSQLGKNKTKDKQKSKPKETVVSEVPHISTLKVRSEFNWFNYPEELDEVPYLLLFRVHLFPHLHHKTTMELKRIQELCLMSGLSNFTLKDVNNQTTRLAGDIAKGGLIKAIVLFLTRVQEDSFYIDNCIFKAFT